MNWVGTGENQLYGQNGNDTIFCQNGILDFVDGGAGFDQAHADGIDLLSSIETLF
jgi:Ca2+-binding RTX toxin-like protein